LPPVEIQNDSRESTLHALYDSLHARRVHTVHAQVHNNSSMDSSKNHIDKVDDYDDCVNFLSSEIIQFMRQDDAKRERHSYTEPDSELDYESLHVQNEQIMCTPVHNISLEDTSKPISGIVNENYIDCVRFLSPDVIQFLHQNEAK
jgi:hypothetical protein